MLLAGSAPWTPSAPLLAGSPEPPAQRHDVGSHTSTGVVMSITATTLVIRHADGSSLTFELTADTYRDGTVAAGVEVSVRYRQEGRVLVATAVTERRRKG